MMTAPHFKVSLVIAALAGFAMTPPASADDLTGVFDARHKQCLESIADDSRQAYEEALIWRGQGGGRRAKHCIAMALFALGQEDEAAHRLDQLAEASDGGSPAMRADFRLEATNFWLVAKDPVKAYESATAGLKIDPHHVDLRIARARAYALSGNYNYAQIELDNVLKIRPRSADAFRYRADAKLEQGDLSGAKSDIQRAFMLDETSVDTALLRGRIFEAIRKAGLPQP